jgi:hypothetical protein
MFYIGKAEESNREVIFRNLKELTLPLARKLMEEMKASHGGNWVVLELRTVSTTQSFADMLGNESRKEE